MLGYFRLMGTSTPRPQIGRKRRRTLLPTKGEGAVGGLGDEFGVKTPVTAIQVFTGGGDLSRFDPLLAE